MLIKIQEGKPTGYPVLESNFKQLFPSTSFPLFLTPEDVEPFGFGMYEFTSPPQPNKHQKVIELDPVRSDTGFWQQCWQVVEMNDDEKLEADEEKAYFTRVERSIKLSETDWVVIFYTEKNTPIPVEWKIYRQALRDITDHANFPYLQETDWPVKP
jgi:hypothetical protein